MQFPKYRRTKKSAAPNAIRRMRLRRRFIITRRDAWSWTSNAVIQCSYRIIFFDSHLYTPPLNVPTSRNNNNTHSLVSTLLVHTLRIRLPLSSLTIHGNNAYELRGRRQADSCPIGFLSLPLRLDHICDRSMFCLWSYDGRRACSRWIRHRCMT